MVRVVSLLPAATEAAAETGCLGAIVGISPECAAVLGASASASGSGSGSGSGLGSGSLGAAALRGVARAVVVAEPKHSAESMGGAQSASSLDATQAAARGAFAEIGLGPWGPRGAAAGAGAHADAAEATTADRVAVIWQLSAYCVHADALRDLRPDAVLTNVQGGAPAVPAMTSALRRWTRNPALRLVHLDPQSLHDCAADVVAVAAACHAPLRGTARAAELTTALARVRSAAAASAAGLPHRIALCQWTDPVYSASAWTAELLAVAAPWATVVPRGPSYGPWEPAQLRSTRPDLVVVAICGFGIPESVREAVALMNKAFPVGVPAPRVVVVDARRLFTVAGPASVAQAAALLATIVRGPSAEGILDGVWDATLASPTQHTGVVDLERSLAGTWTSVGPAGALAGGVADLARAFQAA